MIFHVLKGHSAYRKTMRNNSAVNRKYIDEGFYSNTKISTNLLSYFIFKLHKFNGNRWISSDIAIISDNFFFGNQTDRNIVVVYIVSTISQVFTLISSQNSVFSAIMNTNMTFTFIFRIFMNLWSRWWVNFPFSSSVSMHCVWPVTYRDRRY